MAASCARQDRPLVYVEDVGRHNAVDKIAGWMFLNKVAPENKIFYTTGRLTSEMILKCVAMRIPDPRLALGLHRLGGGAGAPDRPHPHRPRPRQALRGAVGPRAHRLRCRHRGRRGRRPPPQAQRRRRRRLSLPTCSSVIPAQAGIHWLLSGRADGQWVPACRGNDVKGNGPAGNGAHHDGQDHRLHPGGRAGAAHGRRRQGPHPA